MKMNLMVKTALTALVAFGAANAAQRVDVHADYRGKPAKHLEVESSRLRNQVDHPTPAMVAVALPRMGAIQNSLDLMNVTENAMTIPQYVAAAKARVIAHLNHWIDADLMNPDAPFLNPNVANVANAAGVAAIPGLAGATPRGALAGIGAGMAIPMQNLVRNATSGGVAWAPNTVPADLTRDAFKTAMAAHINAITDGELTLVDGRVARPADGHLETIMDLNTGFKNAMEHEIMDWLDNLLPANIQFLQNAVSNTGIHNGIGHGGAVNAPAGGTAGNRPDGNFRDDFAVKLQEIMAHKF